MKQSRFASYNRLFGTALVAAGTGHNSAMIMTGSTDVQSVFSGLIVKIRNRILFEVPKSLCVN